jgi:WhiB family transcriptional regulator, redox-sensing transcriptional regulator
MTTAARQFTPAVVLQVVFTSPGEPRYWQDEALCAEIDPEIFFPEKGGSTWQAKRVCRSCPVRSECLDYALTHEDAGRYGIWGGFSERERRRLKGRAA